MPGRQRRVYSERAIRCTEIERDHFGTLRKGAEQVHDRQGGALQGKKPIWIIDSGSSERENSDMDEADTSAAGVEDPIDHNLVHALEQALTVEGKGHLPDARRVVALRLGGMLADVIAKGREAVGRLSTILS